MTLEAIPSAETNEPARNISITPRITTMTNAIVALDTQISRHKGLEPSEEEEETSFSVAEKEGLTEVKLRPVN